MGVEMIVQLAFGLIKAIPQLVAALPQVITAIVTGIGKAAISIVEVGKNIVVGLWDGIASMMGWIKEKISGFVGGIVLM
jgi:phage-related protein